MHETAPAPAARAQASSRILSGTLSMQSATKSYPEKSNVSAVSAVKKRGIARTCASGLISRARAAITSALFLPIVPVSATSWRFRLEGATASPSTKSSAPIARPHERLRRVRADAAQPEHRHARGGKAGESLFAEERDLADKSLFHLPLPSGYS